MSKQINHWRIAIYLIQSVLLTLIVYFYLGEIFDNDSNRNYISIALIIFIIVADYLSRAYITNIFIFFLVHLLFIGSTILIPYSITDKILTSIISLMFFILSIVFWKSEEKKNDVNVFEIPLGILAFVVPVYIHCSLYYSSFIIWYVYISAVLFLVLCLLRSYLNKLRIQLLSNNSYTAALQHSFKANFYLINVFNAGLILVFTCINIIYSDKISSSIAKFFKFIAKFILGFLPTNSDKKVIEETTSFLDETVSVDFNSETILPPEKTHSSGAIFDYLVKLLIIAIIAGIAYALYKFIMEFLHRNRTTDDIVEKLSEKDYIGSTRKSVSDHNHFSFFSVKDRIRKIYKHTVNSCIKKDAKVRIRKSFTPDEIENTITKAEVAKEDNMKVLTDLYEKARYSNLEMTKEDVSKAKKGLSH